VRTMNSVKILHAVRSAITATAELLVITVVVRSRTGQPLLSDTIRQRHLSFLVICAVLILVKTTPSSPGLHSGSSQRLATKNWKTEANLAEKG